MGTKKKYERSRLNSEFRCWARDATCWSAWFMVARALENLFHHRGTVDTEFADLLRSSLFAFSQKHLHFFTWMLRLPVTAFHNSRQNIGCDSTSTYKS